MTDNEKYEALLREIGEILEHKNNTIYLQKIQIEYLEKKLKEAEAKAEDFARNDLK